MHGNIPAVLRKRDRDGMSDAFCRTCNECNFSSICGHKEIKRSGASGAAIFHPRGLDICFSKITFMQLQLPEPSYDALMASRALQAHIANDIRHHSGWISFARYMELALYAPGLGYYSGGAAKLGKDGDFTTAP